MAKNKDMNKNSDSNKKKDTVSKNKGLIIGGAVILLVLLIFGYGVGKYNNFIGLDQNVNSRWSEVENQYQRQADLIPNLVSVVASAVRVETGLLTNVTEARSRWQTARNINERDLAGIQMTNGVTAIVNAVATTENYPVLQANKQYVALTDELSGTQNRISVARGRYIESVQSYNTVVRRFPSNILAGMFGFEPKEYYQASLDAMTNPQIGTGQLP